MSMSFIARSVLVLAVGLPVMATAAQAQVQPSKPAAPAAPTPIVDKTRPDGALIRCNDGTWAPKGATVAACETHGGLAYRLPEIIAPPAPLARPDASTPKFTPRPAPSGALSSEERAQRNADAAAAQAKSIKTTRVMAPTAPPADATLACKDGTYLSGQAEAARCDAHGGLAVFLPAARRP